MQILHTGEHAAVIHWVGHDAPFRNHVGHNATSPAQPTSTSDGTDDAAPPFVIKDPGTFSRDMLPQHFQLNSLSSFIQQLHTYGFRRVAGSAAAPSAASANGTNAVTRHGLSDSNVPIAFQHAHFRPHGWGALSSIRREHAGASGLTSTKESAELTAAAEAMAAVSRSDTVAAHAHNSSASKLASTHILFEQPRASNDPPSCQASGHTSASQYAPARPERSQFARNSSAVGAHALLGGQPLGLAASALQPGTLPLGSHLAGEQRVVGSATNSGLQSTALEGLPSWPQVVGDEAKLEMHYQSATFGGKVSMTGAAVYRVGVGGVDGGMARAEAPALMSEVEALEEAIESIQQMQRRRHANDVRWLDDMMCSVQAKLMERAHGAHGVNGSSGGLAPVGVGRSNAAGTGRRSSSGSVSSEEAAGTGGG